MGTKTISGQGPLRELHIFTEKVCVADKAG